MSPILVVRLVVLLSSILGIAGIYYYWKDSIEEAVFAQIELKQKQAEIELLERQRMAADETIKQLHTTQLSHQVSQGILLKRIQEVADEKSCLRTPITPNDKRLLEELWRGEGGSP